MNRDRRRAALLAVHAAALVTLSATAPSWTAQPSGVTSRLRGVSAVDARVAWASGAAGTVIRTIDGGQTWQARTIPGTEGLDFRDIDAIDARTAFVLSIGPGEASRIYKTTDGGEQWTLSFRNEEPKAFFDAMAFWDAARGLAVSDSIDGHFVIQATRDGGRTWARVPLDGLPPALPNEGCFAASGTNVAVWGTQHAWIGTGASSDARVLRTTDGGRTWAVARTPVPAGPSAGIFSVAFRDATHGVIVGGDYKKEADAFDNVATTVDGGATWTLVKDRGLSGFRSAVAFAPGALTRRLIAVGPSGADRSGDDGRSWQPIGGALGFHGLSVARDGGVAWAVGEQGRISQLDITSGFGGR
jgi:photosystem II stability/assembly factor-like uncharacterized protein